MRVQAKAFLIVLAMSIVIILALTQLMEWSLDRGLLDYVNQREQAQLAPLLGRLAERYQRDGNWQAFANNRRLLHDLAGESRVGNGPRPGSGPHRNERRPPPPRDIRKPGTPQMQLLDVNGRQITGNRPVQGDFRRIEIQSDNVVIGYLALPPVDQLPDDFQLQFVDAQREALLLIGLLVLVLAGLMALLAAPAIVRPVRKVALGAHQLINGDYNVNLPTNRSDEIGELYRDVNELARTLNDHRTQRQRWVADISHELRTPLAILLGEIEAMLDGVREVNQQQLSSLLAEVRQLQQLVDDLDDLGAADIGSLRYRKDNIDLAALVAGRVAALQPQAKEAGLDLSLTMPHSPVVVWADVTRMTQLLDNCLGNSLKYTDAPGAIEVTLEQEEHSAVLQISDSAPGVPDEALPHLFDYLYRVDSSRNRATGGSGLGLAMAKRIVEAHGGHIKAQHSEQGGITIAISMPLGDVRL